MINIIYLILYAIAIICYISIKIYKCFCEKKNNKNKQFLENNNEKLEEISNKNLNKTFNKKPNKKQILITEKNNKNQEQIKTNHKNKIILKNKHKNPNKKEETDPEKIIKQQIQKQLKFIESLNPNDYITSLNNINIHQIVLRRNEILQQ